MPYCWPVAVVGQSLVLVTAAVGEYHQRSHVPNNPASAVNNRGPLTHWSPIRRLACKGGFSERQHIVEVVLSLYRPVQIADLPSDFNLSYVILAA